MSHARIPRRSLSREINSFSSGSASNVNSPQSSASVSNYSSSSLSNLERRSTRTANFTLANSPVPSKRSKPGNSTHPSNNSLESFGFHSVSKREPSGDTIQSADMDYSGPNGFKNHTSNSASSVTNPKTAPVSGTVMAGPKRLSIRNAKGI